MRPSRILPWILALLTSSMVLTAGILAINTFLRPAERAAASDAATALTGATRDTADEASRGFARADPAASPLPSGSVPPTSPAPSAPPARLPPVAGLKQLEMDNAVAIVRAGQRMNLPKRAYVVAIVTALQESHLRNLANSKVPQSLKVPHQGVESNFDSVGLFQQRPSQGWGTAAELMDPTTAATRFYARLAKVSGWPTMTVGDAAQAVQRSAFPDAYDKHQAQAQKIVDAIAG
ncbi:hypothetical protein HC031_31690 [Planosporangium thailandense]|uniref:Peptidase M23 n=1 Tax=Planosporangium thailandense TaxID=765197 RepID=A0ABX0YA12_9ACTN|nr:hypothetical protein [Planosporangium thailandense]NJC74243.1 hypothetical protein [Planosporangium thailandense]